MELVQKSLNQIKPKLKEMTAPELLDNLKVLPPGATYAQLPIVVIYTWNDGNQMIIKELKNRPQVELEAIRIHTNDENIIFTEDAGPYESVGAVVSRILKQ